MGLGLKTTATDCATAYHEAGHAVVAFALNTWVRQVSIDTLRMPLADGRDGIADGYTDLTRRLPKNYRVSNGRLMGADHRSVVQQIAVNLAGFAASVRAACNETTYHPNDGDYAAIRVLLDRVVQAAPREDTNRMYAEGQQLMARELDEHWPDVERVAEALLRERVLDESGIRALLGTRRKK